MSTETQRRDRRQFLKTGLAALVASLSGCAHLKQQTIQDDRKAVLLQRLREHNVTLTDELHEKYCDIGSGIRISEPNRVTDEFSLDELEDMVNIFDIYEFHMGDIRSFRFNVGKLLRNETLYRMQTNPQSSRYTTSPLAGYATAGVYLENSKQIAIAPQRVLRNFALWRKSANQIPEGEEIPDNAYFRWTLAHEIGHAISYALGFGEELGNAQKPNDKSTKFYTAWKELDEQIRDACPEPVARNSDRVITKFHYVRPQGFPSHYSYTINPPRMFQIIGENGEVHVNQLLARPSQPEVFADTVAYIITGARYAHEDQWFLKRTELVKQLFDDLKHKTGKYD